MRIPPIQRCHATSGKEYLQLQPVLFCFLKEAFRNRSEATVVVCSWETDDSDPIHAVERLFYEARQSCGWTWRGVWRQTSQAVMPAAVSDDCPIIRRWWHILLEVFFKLWVGRLHKKVRAGNFTISFIQRGVLSGQKRTAEAALCLREGKKVLEFALTLLHPCV